MSAILSVTLPLAGGLAVGIGALLAVLWLAPRARPVSIIGEHDILAEPRVFCFHNGYLTEHSNNVSFLLPAPIDHLKAWDDLTDVLGEVHEGAEQAFADLRDTGRPFKLTGQFGRDRILILGIRDGEDIRVTVTTAEDRQDSVRIDLPSLKAMEEEVAMLTRAGDCSPTLSWAVDGEGQVVWSNAAYIAAVARCVGVDAARGWPLHALFPEASGTPDGKTRRKIRNREGAELWFEVARGQPGPDGLRHMHALSLDTTIKAEESFRTFIQTLTKSFAFLPTGLAIFDREGQLALFNPTLMDMTGLDGAWLSRRPRLSDFFDALRDRQKLPEPRDYKAWRDGLTCRDQGAGTYVETWTLPSGTTFRVTVRPQDDGAVTLMLEDISANVVAMRDQRERQDMMQNLLDTMDEAVVVFDMNGKVLVSNDAVRALWFDGEAASAELPGTLEGCIAFWKSVGGSGAVWSDLRAFLRLPEAERAEWSDVLRSREFGDLSVRVIPLPGSRVAVGFGAAARPEAPFAPAYDLGTALQA